jgi:hypothetical protein
MSPANDESRKATPQSYVTPGICGGFSFLSLLIAAEKSSLSGDGGPHRSPPPQSETTDTGQGDRYQREQAYDGTHIVWDNRSFAYRLFHRLTKKSPAEAGLQECLDWQGAALRHKTYITNFGSFIDNSALGVHFEQRSAHRGISCKFQLFNIAQPERDGPCVCGPLLALGQFSADLKRFLQQGMVSRRIALARPIPLHRPSNALRCILFSTKRRSSSNPR